MKEIVPFLFTVCRCSSHDQREQTNNGGRFRSDASADRISFSHHGGLHSRLVNYDDRPVIGEKFCIQ
jgi:hypothetical protein